MMIPRTGMPLFWSRRHAFERAVMINLIVNLSAPNGPGKVVTNLLRGLALIGFDDFVLNGRPSPAFEKTHIINVAAAVGALQGWIDESYILGPNLFVMPEDDRSGVVLEAKYRKYIQPSAWAADAWGPYLPQDKVAVWAVGIDTDEFPDISSEKKTNDVLVYFKRRDPQALETCTDMLQREKLSYTVIEYGSYGEAAYKHALAASRSCVWIGSHESQGIALEECLSSGVPVLVWDVQRFSDADGWSGSGYPDFPVTTVPYWDGRCGDRVFSADDLRRQLPEFLARATEGAFEPREFVLENLSLEKQAREFLAL